MPEIGRETISSLLGGLHKDYVQARDRRLKRYEQGLGEHRKRLDLYGKEYVSGQERTALAAATQRFAGSGMGGTTRPVAVSAGMRAGFEDVRREQRSGIMGDTANYMAGFKDIYPEPSTLSHLATGGFSGMLQEQQLGMQQAAAIAGGVPIDGGRTTGGTYGASSFPDQFSIPGEAGTGGGTAAPKAPSFTAPSGSYGSLAEAVDVKMGTLGPGATYYGAAAQTNGAGSGGTQDLSGVYKGWADEMRRRYPGKPVMPQSRWERLVYPKMGASAQQFGGGDTVSAGMGATGFPGMKL